MDSTQGSMWVFFIHSQRHSRTSGQLVHIPSSVRSVINDDKELSVMLIIPNKLHLIIVTKCNHKFEFVPVILSFR